MFTGLVQAVGRIERIDPHGSDVRVHVGVGDPERIVAAVGDSIAVAGICLTAGAISGGGFSADVSRETLSLTTAGDWRPGSAVNLEPALTLAQPLGGHLMSGHVDGVGRLLSMCVEGRSRRLRFEVPAQLARYIARKGSVAVDGVSLTVNEVKGAMFGVNIIPHTAETTTLGHLRGGERVNIEVDLIARYLERLLTRPEASGDADEGLRALLERQGFISG